jgi:hypothetical protein
MSSLLELWTGALRSEIAAYAFVVDANDEIAEGFYKAYQFLPLVGSGRRQQARYSPVPSVIVLHLQQENARSTGCS